MCVLSHEVRFSLISLTNLTQNRQRNQPLVTKPSPQSRQSPKLNSNEVGLKRTNSNKKKRIICSFKVSVLPYNSAILNNHLAQMIIILQPTVSYIRRKYLFFLGLFLIFLALHHKSYLTLLALLYTVLNTWHKAFYLDPFVLF